ncbi:putative selenate ABC transporter substrate-binding protein [Terrisporobacter vanillatitrophus]|uniref:putative selenate ABC transporter substrate-binding protein n=1 Tax=Terrisporobacter vanillatitrophus TaxID=3058402 RepID=UPI003365B9A7
MKKKLLSIILCITMVSILALTGCGSSSEDTAKNKDLPTLKIGAIPDQDTAQLEKGNDALATYLSDYLGFEVEFVPTVDYASLVEGFQRGDIQLAWFGGLTYVQARNIVPNSEMIIQRLVDQSFQSVFIKNKDVAGDVESVMDLKGRTFTFGSESSTSGHLMPRYFMKEEGFDVNKDLKGDPNYSGSHDTTIQLVESGSYETGVLNITVWNKALKEGTVDTDKVEVFYTTPEYYDYGWTLNAPTSVDDIYGEGTRDKIIEAFKKMNEDYGNNDNATTALDFYQTKEWIEAADASAYDKLESVAKSLNLLQVTN